MRHEALHDPLTGLAEPHAAAATASSTRSPVRERERRRAPRCCSSTSTTSSRSTTSTGTPPATRVLVELAPAPADRGAPGRHGRAARRRRVRRGLRGRRRGSRRSRSASGSPTAIGEPFDVDGVEHAVSASIGIALGTAAATRTRSSRRRRAPLPREGGTAAAASSCSTAGCARHARERQRTAEALELRTVAGPAAARVPADRRAGRRRGHRPRGAAALGPPGRRCDARRRTSSRVAEGIGLIVEIGALGAAPRGVPRGGAGARPDPGHVARQRLARTGSPDLVGGRRCGARRAHRPRGCAWS